MLKLLDPIFYFPVSRNAFSFKAGLNKLPLLTTDNSQKVFQIDTQWTIYHQQKLLARKESLSKYVQTKKLSSKAYVAACESLCTTLLQQQTEYFSIETSSDSQILRNHISEEMLRFDNQYNLLESSEAIDPAYENLLDALCCQLQEDFSIVHVDNEGHDNLAYLHLCFPNHWAAEDKIGKCFQGVHKYVPAMETINKSAEQLNTLLATQGPFERFTWGISTDTRLNHHPHAPQHQDAEIWKGRSITATGPLYLRIERQVTMPFISANAYMFSIRTYFLNIETLNSDQLGRLQNSISTMSPEVLEYKGIGNNKSLLLQRLQDLLQMAQ